MTYSLKDVDSGCCMGEGTSWKLTSSHYPSVEILEEVIHLPAWTRLLQGSLTKCLGKSPGSKLQRFPQMWHKGRRPWPAWLHSWVGPVVAQSHRSPVTTAGAAVSTWSFTVKATENTCNIVETKGRTDQETDTQDHFGHVLYVVGIQYSLFIYIKAT